MSVFFSSQTYTPTVNFIFLSQNITLLIKCQRLVAVGVVASFSFFIFWLKRGRKQLLVKGRTEEARLRSKSSQVRTSEGG